MSEHLVEKAIATIKKQLPPGNKPHAGSIECPVCRKVLEYAVYSNGHIHGVCETEGCLRWMM